MLCLCKVVIIWCLNNCFLSACHRSLQHCRWVFITFSCMLKCFSLLSCHLSSSLSHNTNRRRQIWESSQSRECSCSLLMISSSTICCYLFCGWVWVRVSVFVVNWDRKGKSAPLFSSLDFGKVFTSSVKHQLSNPFPLHHFLSLFLSWRRERKSVVLEIKKRKSLRRKVDFRLREKR